MQIRPMTPEDWHEVARIYAEGIGTGVATFETRVPTYEAWDSAHLPECRLVAQAKDGQLAGWAALSPVSGRCVYGGVAELSVYVSSRHRGSGTGKALLAALIPESEARGIWTLQSGVFPENSASIRLHESCGFRRLGYREKIARRNGVWKDNILFERRSRTVGID
ncbi:GNAT family N-acetyltransferase [Robiginitalea sp. SC105]|uniref:GNAT family N-acetyltransferase n=1 Tax=Robiginitalea sp. SC105 TaxID=2762332 RepID=UPI001639CB05|nr:GNAT family N-acetyltransferase [Robiginitalea sp. SC105]MBC2838525.1 N-acetyltransferase [Robiginitalea sp. SC105]